jgi:hypothetical protein
MKKYCILIILVGSSMLINAQIQQNRKADYQWWMGYERGNPPPNGWKFDFNVKPMNYGLIEKKLTGVLLNANICDKNGNLSFHTDGCRITNSANQIILGGDTINAGQVYDYACAGINGYSPPQGTIILPSTIDDSTYYIFHLRQNINIDIRMNRLAVDRLLLTKIVKKNDKYKVEYKDSIILDFRKDSLFSAGQLTACRHANGRDWWIILPKVFETDYHVLLFSPKGITKRVMKNIGIPTLKGEYGGGMAVFSPDGTKYIRYNFLSDAQIFNFDRCTGELSNFKHISITDDADSTWFSGCGVSPSSRFLYLSSSSHLYQYDLQSDIIETTKFTFSIQPLFDSVQHSYINSAFNTCQIGPDGKIYITMGAERFMHVIEKPDFKGEACELKQHSLTLSKYITWAIPFFPNYRLGAQKGSPCDTLTTPTQEINQIGQLKIYPNPATDILKIDMTLDDYSALERCQLRVVDIVGKVHQTHTLSNFASIKEISVANLANGLYFVQLVDKQGFLIANSKVVVAR